MRLPCKPRSAGTALLASLAALAGPALLSPAAHAALAVEHLSTSVTENGGSDGVIAPGDQLAIDETIISSQVEPLTQVTGTLSSATTGVTVPTATASYPNLSFGGSGTNLTPFVVDVGGDVQCGTQVRLSLAVSATVGTGQDSQTLNLAIPTGERGPFSARESSDVPRAIPDGGTTTAQLDVAATGRVKGVRVRIGRITHPYVSDLRVTLIAPDGTSVVLFDRHGGTGDNLVDTTFSDDAATGIAGGTAPFTGTFRPQGDLGAFDGVSLEGTWKLRVSDVSLGESGRLDAWGTDLAPALCTSGPSASLVATPNPVQPGQTVTLDASGSVDPNGTITNYRWDLDGDGTYETEGGTSPTTSTSFPSRRSATVGVQVTDDQANTDTATTKIAVTTPPTAALTHSPSAPLTGQSVTFDGSGSTDADGTIVDYAWDLDGNGSFEVSGATASVSRSYATPGAVPVRLRVTDDNGASHTANLDLTVVNRPPTAALQAPSVAVVGRKVSLSAASSSDPDSAITDHAWDLDGDGSHETRTGPGATVDHTFLTHGTVNVGLHITDEHGGEDSTTASVRVTAAPKAVLSATPQPASPRSTVTLSAAGSTDADGTIARHQWDLDGDGSFERDTGTTAQTTIKPPSPGTRTVGLRVTDDLGITDSTTASVAVVNATPVAALTASPAQPLTGQAVTFDASGSTDAEGALVLYEWDLDGDGSFERVGTDPRTARSYPNAGVIGVRVRVTDLDGASAIRRLDVKVVAPSSGTSSPTGTTGGTPTGGGGGTGPGSGTGGGTAAPVAPGLYGPAIQELGPASRKGIVVACVAPAGSRCTLRATVSRRDARRLRIARRARKAVTVGRAKGAPGVLWVRLTRNAKRQLPRGVRGKRRVTVRLSGTIVDPSGRRLRVKRVVLLRRTKARLSGPAVQRVASAARRGIVVDCVAPLRSRCALHARVSSRDARRLGLKGSATVGRVDARSGVLRMRLTKDAKRQLRDRVKRGRSMTVRLSGTVREPSGRRVAVRRAIRLHR